MNKSNFLKNPSYIVTQSLIVFVSLVLLLVGCQTTSITQVPSNDPSATINPTISTTNNSNVVSFDTARTIRIQETADFGNTSQSASGRILHSETELQEAGLDTLIPYDSNQPIDTSAYTKDFFANKALILLYVTMGSGSYQIIPYNVAYGDNNLTAYIDASLPGSSTTMTADMAYWCILLEVNKSEVFAATNIAVKINVP